MVRVGTCASPPFAVRGESPLVTGFANLREKENLRDSAKTSTLGL